MAATSPFLVLRYKCMYWKITCFTSCVLALTKKLNSLFAPACLEVINSLSKVSQKLSVSLLITSASHWGFTLQDEIFMSNTPPLWPSGIAGNLTRVKHIRSEDCFCALQGFVTDETATKVYPFTSAWWVLSEMWQLWRIRAIMNVLTGN